MKATVPDLAQRSLPIQTEGQRPQSFAGCCKNRIADRRRNTGRPYFSDPPDMGAGIRDLNDDFRSIVQCQDGIAIKIVWHYSAVVDFDLAVQGRNRTTAE